MSTLHPKTTVVVGGGLAGVATAYELATRGERVLLLDAQPDLAAVTSFANGGMLTASMSDPWNGPGVGRHLVSSLFDPVAPMKLRAHAIPGLMTWGARFIAHSSSKSHAAATVSNFKLADYSVRRTAEITDQLNLAYDSARVGSLKIFSDVRALEAPRAISAMLAPLGLRFQVLSTEEVIAIEPALAPARWMIARALFYPDDSSGDACAFTRTLAEHARAAGAEIRTGVPVLRVVAKHGKVVGVETAMGNLSADRVVLAAGCRTPALARPLGVALHIKPAKGYSITIRPDEPGASPMIPVVDDAMHAAVTPLGDRLRAVGTAEFTGNDVTIDRKRIDNLLKLLERLYPRVARNLDPAKAVSWAGLRPMSADGVPFVGAGGPSGLWINSGHGHLGWTMAMGSGRLLSDLMLGAEPALDPHPYRIGR